MLRTTLNLMIALALMLGALACSDDVEPTKDAAPKVEAGTDAAAKEAGMDAKAVEAGSDAKVVKDAAVKDASKAEAAVKDASKADAPQTTPDASPKG